VRGRRRLELDFLPETGDIEPFEPFEPFEFRFVFRTAWVSIMEGIKQSRTAIDLDIASKGPLGRTVLFAECPSAVHCSAAQPRYRVLYAISATRNVAPL
jgi:hypothetical protein